MNNENQFAGVAPENQFGTDDIPTPVVSQRRRGFAAMTTEQVRAIASRGGKMAHASGTAHEWTSEEARVAGRKGGTTPRVRKSIERI